MFKLRSFPASGRHWLLGVFLASLLGVVPLAGAQVEGASVHRLLQEAQAAQTRKDFVGAAEKYKLAAELEPRAELYEKAGLAYFLATSYPAAVEAFSKALHIDPKRWASQLFVGESLYKLNRFEEALPHITSALDLNPDQNEARYWLGCVNHALGRFEEADAQLLAASSHAPQNTDILYSLTESYLDYSTVLSQQVDSAALPENRKQEVARQIHALGSVGAEDEKVWKSAVSQLRALADGYKTASKAEPITIFSLSLIYGQLGQLMAERVWVLDPQSYRSHELLGQSFENQGNFQAALPEYREALQVNPGAPGLNYAIGHTYWEMKKLNDAIPPLEKELQLNPAHPSANYLLGHIYLHTTPQQLDKAVVYLQRAIAANPNYFAAREQLGQAFSLMHRDREAVYQLELAAVESPRDEQVHYLLAGIYRKMGFDDKAKREFEKFNQLRAEKHAAP